jgi:hypothetical protein
MKKIKLKKELANAAEGVSLALCMNLKNAICYQYIFNDLINHIIDFKVRRFVVIAFNHLRILDVELSGLKFSNGELIEIPPAEFPNAFDIQDILKERDWGANYAERLYSAFKAIPKLLSVFIEAIDTTSEDPVTLDFKSYLTDVSIVTGFFVGALPYFLELAWKKDVMSKPREQPNIPTLSDANISMGLFPGAPESMTSSTHKELSCSIINKGEQKLGLVTGIVLEPGEKNSADLQGQWIKAEAIEAAAHLYMEKYAVLGFMHKQFHKKQGTENPDFRLIENYIAPVDLDINGVKVKKGTWIQTWKIMNAVIRDKVYKGEYKGFSIGGIAWLNAAKLLEENNAEPAAKAFNVDFSTLFQEIAA